jgi:hypothetical protein
VSGYSVAALIFAREVSDPLTSLVKQIDKQLAGTPAPRPGMRKPGVFVVLCNDDAGMRKQFQGLIAKEGIKHVVLCTTDSEGPKNYRLAREAAQTVVIYKGAQVVSANYPLKKGELNEKKAKEIRKALADVLPR